MTQFHEGQEVEVRLGAYIGPAGWRKAKIVRRLYPGSALNKRDPYSVQYGTTIAVFDAEHIRAPRSAMRSDGTAAQLWPSPAEEYSELAEPDDDTSDPMDEVAP